VAYANTPVFVAKDANGNRQPITAAPAVAYGPGAGYLVSFGSGRMLATGNNLGRQAGNGVSAFDAQSFYALWDDLSTPVTDRTRLAPRTASLTDGAGNVSGAAFKYGNGSTDKRGWFLDLPDATSAGERVINPPLLSFGRVFFNTVIPGADPCSNGLSRSYGVSVLQGLGPIFGSAAGYLAAPLILRTDLAHGTPDPTGLRADQMQSALINLGTTGQEIQQQPSANVAAGAWNWRELINWRELRRAP
jgi:type IV pilus assembly protein PilY1